MRHWILPIFPKGCQDLLKSPDLGLIGRPEGRPRPERVLKDAVRRRPYESRDVDRIVGRLKAGEFLSSFTSKGRLSPVLARIPVHVVVTPRVGVLGAAAAAVSPFFDGLS